MGIMRDHIIPAPMRHTEVLQGNTIGGGTGADLGFRKGGFQNVRV